MEISIIIPAKNLENYISKALDSIAMQIYDKTRFEVLIVCDSCTDNTKGVVESWANNNPDIKTRVFCVQHGNQGMARNVGLDNAVGKYIYFMDGDDWLIADNALSDMHQAIQGFSALQIIEHETPNPIMDKIGPPLWKHMFARELVGDTRMRDVPFNEDYIFIFGLKTKSGYSETTLQGPYYFYNSPREGSIVATTFSSHMDKIVASRKRALLKLLDWQGDFDSLKVAVQNLN